MASQTIKFIDGTSFIYFGVSDTDFMVTGEINCYFPNIALISTYKWDPELGTYGWVTEEECPPTQRALTDHICGQCDMATARWSAHSSGAPKQYLCSMCYDVIAEWAQKMYGKLHAV